MNRSGICKYAVAAVVSAALLAAAVWGSGWLWSRRDAGTPPQTEVKLLPERVDAPGRPVIAELTLKLPLWRRVRSAVAEPGKDTVLSGPVAIASHWRWSYRIWRISAVLRPLKAGESAPGRLSAELSGTSGAAAELLDFAIPPLRTNARKPEVRLPESPLLAGAETPPPDRGKWYYLLLLLIPAALAGWWAYRRFRRHGEAEVPPWERARRELCRLRAEIAAGRLAPAAGVERLTDVVREYLEARFEFPASRLTTAEFLAEVAGNPELPAVERQFLRDFMAGADLVKFARVPAAAAALDDAVMRAELLVENTIPREDEKTVEEARP